MTFRTRLCSVCGRLGAVRLSVKANGGRSPAYGRSVTVGRIDLCAECFERVIERAPRFQTLDDIEEWRLWVREIPGLLQSHTNDTHATGSDQPAEARERAEGRD
jgi:hypothetical protein